MKRSNSAIILFTAILTLILMTTFPHVARAEALFVDQIGRVGIGTNTPQLLTHLFAGSAGNDPVWNPDVDTLLIENDAGNYIQFFTPNTANAGLAWSDPENRTIGQLYYAHSTDSMHFATNSTERMMIDASGNVGIGTTTPTAPLDVRATVIGDNAVKIENTHTTNSCGLNVKVGSNIPTNWIIRAESPAGEVFRVRNDGHVGIGTSNPGTYRLYVAGNAYSTGGWSASDGRWKNKITPLKDSLDRVTHLHGVDYEWNIEKYPDQGFTEGRQIGLIAQEVEQVIPELVHTNDNGFKSISYEKLTVVLVEAIKELKIKNEALKKKNDEIEARLVTLEKHRK